MSLTLHICFFFSFFFFSILLVFSAENFYFFLIWYNRKTSQNYLKSRARNLALRYLFLIGDLTYCHNFCTSKLWRPLKQLTKSTQISRILFSKFSNLFECSTFLIPSMDIYAQKSYVVLFVLTCCRVKIKSNVFYFNFYYECEYSNIWHIEKKIKT